MEHSTMMIAEVFCNVNNGLSFTKKFFKEEMKTNTENWHLNICIVLKKTKTPAFVFITEILWPPPWRNKWRSNLDVVKNHLMLKMGIIFWFMGMELYLETDYLIQIMLTLQFQINCSNQFTLKVCFILKSMLLRNIKWQGFKEREPERCHAPARCREHLDFCAFSELLRKSAKV